MCNNKSETKQTIKPKCSCAERTVLISIILFALTLVISAIVFICCGFNSSKEALAFIVFQVCLTTIIIALICLSAYIKKNKAVYEAKCKTNEELSDLLKEYKKFLSEKKLANETQNQNKNN